MKLIWRRNKYHERLRVECNWCHCGWDLSGWAAAALRRLCRWPCWYYCDWAPTWKRRADGRKHCDSAREYDCNPSRCAAATADWSAPPMVHPPPNYSSNAATGGSAGWRRIRARAERPVNCWLDSTSAARSWWARRGRRGYSKWNYPPDWDGSTPWAAGTRRPLGCGSNRSIESTTATKKRLGSRPSVGCDSNQFPVEWRLVQTSIL